MVLHLTGFGPLAGTLFSLIHGVRLGRERAILHTGFCSELGSSARFLLSNPYCGQLL